MAVAMDVTVTLRGGLFTKNINRVVHDAIVVEILKKVDERMARPRQGKGLGARRNTISRRQAGLELNVRSTLRYPRTTGRKWQRKNIGIIKAMAPRVARTAAERMAGELGG